MNTYQVPLRILALSEVRRRTLYSRAQIYRLEAAGRFPKRVKLGEHRVGWVEAEIEEWLQARLDARETL